MQIGESSLKSHEKKQLINYKAALPTASSSTKNVIDGEDTSEEEMLNYKPGVKQSMIEKLNTMVLSMEQVVCQEISIKLPAIDLIMRIQSALDQNNLFPENSTVNILDIINTIPDKGMTAWKVAGYI